MSNRDQVRIGLKKLFATDCFVPLDIDYPGRLGRGEAQATASSDDGMAICGTGVNPRHNVEARVAKNVMEIDCGDGLGNDGDGFTGCDETDCATAGNCAPE